MIKNINKKKEIKISGIQAFILVIISILLGMGFVYLTIRFPKIYGDDDLMRLIILIYIFPLLMANFSSIPIILPIKTEIFIFKTFLIIITFILAIISFLFTYYFLRSKPVLFDLINKKFTNSFVFMIPYIFFSFCFVIFSNTLLKLTYHNNIIILNYVILIIINISRTIFSLACILLLQYFLVWFRIYLGNP